MLLVFGSWEMWCSSCDVRSRDFEISFRGYFDCGHGWEDGRDSVESVSHLSIYQLFIYSSFIHSVEKKVRRTTTEYATSISHSTSIHCVLCSICYVRLSHLSISQSASQPVDEAAQNPVSRSIDTTMTGLTGRLTILPASHFRIVPFAFVRSFHHRKK